MARHFWLDRCRAGRANAAPPERADTLRGLAMVGLSSVCLFPLRERSGHESLSVCAIGGHTGTDAAPPPSGPAILPKRCLHGNAGRQCWDKMGRSRYRLDGSTRSPPCTA